MTSSRGIDFNTTSLQCCVPAGLSSTKKKSVFFCNFVKENENVMVKVKDFMAGPRSAIGRAPDS